MVVALLPGLVIREEDAVPEERQQHKEEKQITHWNTLLLVARVLSKLA